jgi:hypothetical protein
MPYKQRLNSWIIVRLLPNLQRSVVGRFRSWSDADGQSILDLRFEILD